MRGLRLFECLQLLAPALVGVVACGSPQAPVRGSLIYLAALFLHLLFTYTYNDLSERDHDADNPRKAATVPASRRKLALISLGGFFGCLMLLPWLPGRLAWLVVGFQIAGILYSHPRTLWKGRAPLGDLLHVLTGSGYFLGGCWVDRLRVDPPVIWGAVAFAAIYVSGSLIGQLRDLPADRRAGLRTSAGLIGERGTLPLALTLQGLGLLALVPLAHSMPAAIAVAGILPLHALGVTVSLRRAAPERLQGFQRRYRTVFALAVAIVLIAATPPWLEPDGALGRMLARLQRGVGTGTDAESSPSSSTSSSRSSRVERAITAGVDHLAASREPDGVWVYHRARDIDLGDPEVVPARVFPAMHVLVTLMGVPEADPRWAEPSRRWLLDQMEHDHVWSTDGREHPLTFMIGDTPCWLEPDVESTTLGLVLFGPTLGLDRRALMRQRARFERYRGPSGLYRTYFDEYYGERGCPAYDHQHAPSVGSNLHVLGWVEANGLESGALVAGLEREIEMGRFWESAIYYRSLPMMAHLASNAAALGSPSAVPLLERLLELDRGVHDERGPALRLTADLAAWIQAANHLCRLRATHCASTQAAVDELLHRQQPDGGWPASGIFVSEITAESFANEIYPRVRDALVSSNANAPTLEQALEHAELGRFHYGSMAESTALAVRALHEHRAAEQAARE